MREVEVLQVKINGAVEVIVIELQEYEPTVAEISEAEIPEFVVIKEVVMVI